VTFKGPTGSDEAALDAIGDKRGVTKTIAAMMLALSLTLPACSRDRERIQLGSLNEPGVPVEFVARLQARLKGDTSSESVHTRQGLEKTQVTVDEAKGRFVVWNDSPFRIDQVSFGCDVGRNEFVFFTWDVAWLGQPCGEIAWLEPATTRSFPEVDSTSQLTLLHNTQEHYESLDAAQTSWIISKYHPHGCVALDFASE
jgi:hypothetical protein